MAQSPKTLVERFYADVWNQRSETAARELLAVDFRFRGSLGPERIGQDGFIAYMHSVHEALTGYVCIIQDIVEGEEKAAAKMLFRGTHQAPFFGVEATGKTVEWAGAAFFTMREDRIAALWVLGDIDHVKQTLGAGRSDKFG